MTLNLIDFIGAIVVGFLQGIGLAVVIYFTGRLIQAVLIYRALTADSRRAKRRNRKGRP